MAIVTLPSRHGGQQQFGGLAIGRGMHMRDRAYWSCSFIWGMPYVLKPAEAGGVLGQIQALPVLRLRRKSASATSRCDH